MTASQSIGVGERPGTYAVVVGIDEYAEGSAWSLKGPGKDALRFTEWLCKTQGVPAENIKLLLSPNDDDRELLYQQAAALGIEPGQATLSGVRGVLQSWLPKVEVRPDPCLYFYWSGHGATTINGERRRHIHCADSRADEIVPLKVDDVLNLLRVNPLSRFSRQVCVFDVCAIYRGKKHGAFPDITLTAGEPGPAIDQTTMLSAREGELARTEAKEGRGLFSSVLFEWLDKHGSIEPEALFKFVRARFAELRRDRLTSQHPILCQLNCGDVQQELDPSAYWRPTAIKRQISPAWECAAQEFIDILGLSGDAVERVLAVDLPGLPSRAAVRGLHANQDEQSGHAVRVEALADRLHALHEAGQQAAFVQGMKNQNIDSDCARELASLLESATHAEYWVKLVQRAVDHHLADPANSAVDPDQLVQTHFVAVYPAAELKAYASPRSLDEALFRLLQCGQPAARASAADRFLVRLARVLNEGRLTNALTEMLEPDRYRRIVNELENEIDVAPSAPTHLLIDFNVDEAGRLPEAVDYWLVDAKHPHRVMKSSFATGRDLKKFGAELDKEIDRIATTEGIVVEVFLPYEQLCQSPDDWLLPGPPHSRRTLGRKVPVTVRWRERAMGLPGTGGLEWRQVGGRLAESTARMRTCWVSLSDDPEDINAEFRATDANYCCSFDFSPFEASEPFPMTAHLGAPIASGMSFGVWPRKMPVSEDFRTLVDELFSESATQVPSKLMLRRQTSTSRRDPDFSHMTLFWDHPDRNPLSAQLAEPGQRDTP
ncbi:caspase family protein [Paraburkholderia sp. D15]|uniref:VMAP-C domain-containing protein n=1 Tax=Paraburkholderia sp. D15 TaxID=2880218 RepID=UPI00247A133A|nr:caspase family protein [Paraburkholderia sp. D15]WGS53319.1 caspase family protein [Paraburkholderia sp. D15]